MKKLVKTHDELIKYMYLKYPEDEQFEIRLALDKAYDFLTGEFDREEVLKKEIAKQIYHKIRIEEYLPHIEDIMGKISEFIGSDLKNVWLNNDLMSIYVRKSNRGFNLKMIECFDFATIMINIQGVGIFTEILNQFSKKYPYKNIFVESVLTKRFCKFLVNYGFVPESKYNQSNNFFKLKK